MKQIKTLLVAEPKILPDFFSIILSIFFCKDNESVKEEKFIVVCLTFSAEVLDKKFHTTAVLPVPAEPMKRTGFLRLTWKLSKDFRRVV
jgi:hypothetical protein